MDTEPNYEAISIVEKLQLLQEWAPLISYGQRLVATNDQYAKAVIVGDAIEWLSSKTQSKFDDELAKRLVAIVKTKEGEDLVRWLVAQAEGKS
jgi:hypothetical protein